MSVSTFTPSEPRTRIVRQHEQAAVAAARLREEMQTVPRAYQCPECGNPIELQWGNFECDYCDRIWTEGQVNGEDCLLCGNGPVVARGWCRTCIDDEDGDRDYHCAREDD